MALDQPLIPPKSLINKVSKLLQLLLQIYHGIDNFLVLQCITNGSYVVLLSPSILGYKDSHVLIINCHQLHSL